MNEQRAESVRVARFCCKHCGVEQPIANYEATATGHRRQCNACRSRYLADRYKNNPAVRTANRESFRRAGKANFEKLWEYLKTCACVDCGESDPIVLDFDHVRGTKKRNVSAMVAGSYHWNTILAEIAKCEVRCANCHRRRTAKEQGWKRAISGTGDTPSVPTGKGPFDSDHGACEEHHERS